MSDKIKKFLKEEEGTEVVEWTVIIGLIVVASLGAIIGDILVGNEYLPNLIQRYGVLRGI